MQRTRTARTARTGAHAALRKALAWLLTLALAFSLCGLPAAYGAEANGGDVPDAGSNSPAPDGTDAAAADEEGGQDDGAPLSTLAVVGGSCGQGVTWSFDTVTKVLAIAGAGAMSGYGSGSSIPWYGYRALIGAVTISDGITSIGTNAFNGCTSLTSVSIPASVTSIGEYAFNGCSRLASVSIPASVTGIGKRTFYGCTSLTSVSIPASVVGIDDSAFAGCSSLASVAIGEGVKWIGSGAFSGTSLASVSIPASMTSISGTAFSNCGKLAAIDVADGNPSYSSDDGVLLSKDGSLLVLCPPGKTGAYAVPASVAKIGASAFSGCSLASVAIGGAVSEIGSKAFWGCYSLTSVSIPGSVVSVGSFAFSYCSSLTSVTISEGVLLIGSRAFSYCASLPSVSIPGSVVSIDDGAFWSCESLASVVIGDGVGSIGSSAFAYCRSLASVTVPASVTSIARGAFSQYSRSPLTIRCYTGSAAHTLAFQNSIPFVLLDAKACTLTFDANGGRVAGAASATLSRAEGYALTKLPTPVRAGHTFLGWFTAKARGTQVTTATMVTGDATYWAHWKAKTYTVRYNAAGGKVAGKAVASVKRTHGKALGKLPSPKRAGHAFLGWYTAKSGGKKVASTTKVTKDVVLWAHWKASVYTVSYDAAGGTVAGKAVAPVKRAHGRALGRLPVPAWDGHAFLGWYTGKAGGKKVAAGTKVTKPVTLYAHWG